MSMNELKHYAEALSEQFEKIVTRQRHARTPNMGFNSKRCKSCVNFERCKMFRLRGAMDKACEDYVKKKRR